MTPSSLSVSAIRLSCDPNCPKELSEKMAKSFHHRLDKPTDRIVPRFYVNPELLRSVFLLPESAAITGCTYQPEHDRFVFYVSGEGIPNEQVVVPTYRREDGVTYFDGWR